MVNKSFSGFVKFGIIAAYESFGMNGAYTIYGGFRKRGRVILNPAPRFCSVAIILIHSSIFILIPVISLSTKNFTLSHCTVNSNVLYVPIGSADHP